MGQHEEEHKTVHDFSHTMEDKAVDNIIRNLEDLLDVDELMFPGDGYSKGKSARTIGEALRKPEPKFVSEWGLEFEDLTYSVVKKQKIDGKWESMEVDVIQEISGQARKGQLTAIMGPSDSGKSTLLDALAGRMAEGSLAGTVRYDGQRMTRSYVKRNSAYVMQRDLLFPLLTVTETLLFSAEMRLPSGMPRFEKVDRVQALLMQLGLEDCAHTKVGDERRRGISGGEKRRLSIGVGMIHGPSLLFLDEPTLGLDSTSALIVVEKLFDIAGTGSTVMLTLHQPSYRIQQLLGRIIILARGTVVYQGVPDELGAYLEAFGREVPRNMNSVEYLLDLIKELEHSDEGLNPLLQFHRDGTKDRQPVFLPRFASAFSKTFKSSRDEDDAEGFDHSLTSLRSPFSPGIKLAKTFYRPSWGLIPRCYPQHNQTYYAANITPSSTKTDFHGGIKTHIEALREGKTPSTPCSSAIGESEDNWEGGGWSYQNGWFREVMLLMWRDSKNVIRTQELLTTKAVKAIIMSVLLATLFHNPKNNLDGVYKRLSFLIFLFLLIIVSSIDALPTFIQERYIFIRETSNNTYRASSYVVSTLVVYFPTTFLQALLYVLVTWWALQLHGGFKGFSILTLICFISIVTTDSLAMLVSAVVPNYVIGYSTMIGLTALTFLFSGFLIPRSQIPQYYVWLHYMSTMKYSFEAAVQNEFVKDICFSIEPIPVAPGILARLARNTTIPDYPNCYMIGEDIVRTLDVTQFSIWGCLGMLMLWCFVYRLFLYIVLQYYTTNERK